MVEADNILEIRKQLERQPLEIGYLINLYNLLRHFQTLIEINEINTRIRGFDKKAKMNQKK